jgi:hypothetical protein
MRAGGCHCRAITYRVEGEPQHAALCHCRDCTLAAGAQMVGWGMFAADAVTISGAPTVYASSEDGRRHFCGTCGTGLFYTNDVVFPGLIDIQIATLDDRDALPATVHIQVADDPAWMADEAALPRFDRYPG